MSELRQQLFHEILMARKRVYSVFQPTPLERIPFPINAQVFVKREDLSPAHTFKWRGAYNRMAVLSKEEQERGVIAASSGNHATGVAVAAKKLDLQATIYMPRSTPHMKIAAVERFGGENVEIILCGDHYTEAAKEAQRVCAETGREFIHPYNHLATMGGQGTMADEIVMSGEGPFDFAYLQIGGGGLASAVSCWLKTYYPNIHIVGVEGDKQASMAAAVKAGKPVSLEHVDVFADGTAVQTVGDLTLALCSELIDEYITVTNDELSAGIQMMWETARSIPEPAGSMGIMGMMKQKDRLNGKKVLCIIGGANIDFGQLAIIARHAGIGALRRRYYRVEITEKDGSLSNFLDTIGTANIIEMQYGKVDNVRAWPVVGLEASPPEFHLIEQQVRSAGISIEDVTSEQDVEFRIIHYDPKVFIRPDFLRIAFPERAGALREFMKKVMGVAGLCYFNYQYSGEPIGRALIGFDFETVEKKEKFKSLIKTCGLEYDYISPHVLERMIGSGKTVRNNEI